MIRFFFFAMAEFMIASSLFGLLAYCCNKLRKQITDQFIIHRSWPSEAKAAAYVRAMYDLSFWSLTAASCAFAIFAVVVFGRCSYLVMVGKLP